MGCQTIVRGPKPAHSLFLQIKFYWNIAILIILNVFSTAGFALQMQRRVVLIEAVP